VGTVSSGLLSRGGIDSVMTVAEIRLPTMPAWSSSWACAPTPHSGRKLAVLTAFALSMAQYLPEGVDPELPEGAGSEAPRDDQLTGEVTSMTAAAAVVGVIALVAGVGQVGGVMHLVSGLSEADPLWVRIRSAFVRR
jgi:hypothetical protein